eukprot:scpid74139/ scgid28912/ 
MREKSSDQRKCHQCTMILKALGRLVTRGIMKAYCAEHPVTGELWVALALSCRPISSLHTNLYQNTPSFSVFRHAIEGLYIPVYTKGIGHNQVGSSFKGKVDTCSHTHTFLPCTTAVSGYVPPKGGDSDLCCPPVRSTGVSCRVTFVAT